jgi:hypothetical protein
MVETWRGTDRLIAMGPPCYWGYVIEYLHTQLHVFDYVHTEVHGRLCMCLHYLRSDVYVLDYVHTKLNG